MCQKYSLEKKSAQQVVLSTREGAELDPHPLSCASVQADKIQAVEDRRKMLEQGLEEQS